MLRGFAAMGKTVISHLIFGLLNTHVAAHGISKNRSFWEDSLPILHISIM